MKVEIEIGECPDGYIVLDQIVLLKVLNADGTLCFREHLGSDLNCMEKLGMVASATETIRESIQRSSRHD